MLKRLTILVVVVAAIYGGYWFIGSSAVERGAANAVDDLRAEGWDIAFDDLSTRGFPNRFDTTVTAPRIGLPGVATWSADAFKVYALSYRPNEVIADFPPVQEVVLPDQTIALSTQNMRASARVQAALALPLDNLTLETGPFSAASTQGWEVIWEHAIVAFRAGGPRADAYDFYVNFEAPGVDGIGVPGLTLESVSIDAQALFDAPLDRNADRPALLEVTLRDARIVQGTARLMATGSVAFGPDGAGEGAVEVTAIEWESLIATFEAAGVLAPPQAETLRNAMRGMSGGAADVTMPITVAGGIARFGFVPLGEVRVAPRP